MKKGVVLGISAAFVVIAMLIFIPTIVMNSTSPGASESSAAGESGDMTTENLPMTETDAFSATDTVTEELTDTETDSATVYETDTEPETDEETAEGTAETSDTETADVTEQTADETETETTAKETTAAEETTAAKETTAAEETTTAKETTTVEETTKEPETTAKETEEPVATEEEETLPITTAEVQPLDPNKKYVALTFDDGPHPENTKKITDKMLEYNGKCTFFVVGNLIYGDREKGMQYAYQKGMEIALHCWSHEWYYTKNPEKYHDEVYKGADAIKNSIGVWPTLMRPPGGNITEEQYKSSEFAVIIWDVDSNDWRYKSNKDKTQRENIDIIVNNVMKEVKPGSIILMHEIYENSYLAFCEIIEKLADQGYEFVTVSELLQNPSTGYKYYSATYKKG